MPVIPSLITLLPNTLARSLDLNSNFSAITSTVNTFAALKDTPATISAAWTWTVSAQFSGGMSASGSVTFASGVAITGGTLAASGIAVTAAAAAFSGNVTCAQALNVAGAYTGTGNTVLSQVNDGNSGSAFTINFALGNNHRLTLTATCAITVTNAVAGGVYTIELAQDGAGSHTVTWAAGGGAAVIWPGGVTPTLTTTAAHADLFAFIYDGVPATPKYLGITSGLNYTP
jgi:hypothetical protein